MALYIAAMPETDAASLSLARSGKVLVVEDVALIRLAAMDMIEQLGFAGVEAADGEEALALVRSDPGIGILFTDLGLPGMNGRQLVEEARRLKPDIKIIIASGYSTGAGSPPEDKDIVRLTKPYDMNQLRKALSA
ncbi:MAG TPA: response regulator [Rhizomicrobium sp.]|nr:response regulator [Rhizomicrobium sp.]